MATGRDHFRVGSVIIIPVVVVFAFVAGIRMAIGILAGMLLGLIITPDLDINHPVYSHYLVRKGWGILWIVWRVIWYPYAILIPHRSPLSHWPVVGTFLRVVYLGVWFGYPCKIMFGITPSAIVGFYPVFVGMAMQDALHWIMDC